MQTIEDPLKKEAAQKKRRQQQMQRLKERRRQLGQGVRDFRDETADDARDAEVEDDDNASHQFQYIFYDLETCVKFQEGRRDMRHQVNVACAQMVCQKCHTNGEDDEKCHNCEEPMTFFGREALDEFCRWLFGGATGGKKTLVIAHNSQDKYTHLYIFSYRFSRICMIFRLLMYIKWFE
jgi:hypothetical protein